MNLKTKFYLSVVLNLLLFGVLASAVYTYRAKLYQRFLTKTDGINIVMFGNSIVAQGNWIELLNRTDVANSGLPGRVTYHFLQEINSQVLAKKPKVCFVMGGINDITVGVSEEATFHNYTKLLEILETNQIQPVVSATLYEQNDAISKAKVDRLNAYLKSYCKAKQIPFLNPNRYLSDSTGLRKEFAVDKTHLNEKAYQLWAKDIITVLAQLKI